MGESTLVRALEAGEAAQLHTSTTPTTSARADRTLQEDRDVTMDADVTVELTNKPIYADKTLVISGFDVEHNEKELKSFITQNGGTVLSLKSRAVPDYAVVPIFCNSVELTAGEIVTNAWIQMCVEYKYLIPLEENEIFRPLTVVNSVEDPLKGCVLSISGYQGTERDVYMHIAEFLGATVQEYFVRRANAGKKLEPSTHLVVNAAEGTKYQAAKKWKLPAVTNKYVLCLEKP